MIRILAFALSLGLMSFASEAQQSRYSQWSNPDKTASETIAIQEFRDKLNALVDEAEKAKAADPLFLQDLRNLANGTKTSASKIVLEDSFADGDFTQNPVWTVTDGAYFIENGWGLRNKVQSGQSSDRALSNEEKAIKLFGAILTGKAPQESSGSGLTAVHSLAAVPNAFVIEADLYSVIQDGQFALSTFQGSDRSAGYRLAYSVGEGFSLQRYTRQGISTIATGGRNLALEDKKFHAVQWTRAKDGAMTVSVDGAAVLQATDMSFRDPFQGVELATRGGDFIIKKIRVSGTP